MDKRAMFDQLGKLKLAELEEVSKRVGGRIRVLRKERERKALAKFQEGDLIEFDSVAEGRTVRAQVERITSRIYCVEVGHRDDATPGEFWQIPASACRLVGT